MTMFRKINFWPLPKAPGGRDPKNCARACAIHVNNSLNNTPNLVEFRKKKFYPPTPHCSPNWAWSRQSNENPVWRLICYISFICEKIHKVWFKNIWNWRYNSDLMIFDLLAPPQGVGPKNVTLHAPFMRATHTPFLKLEGYTASSARLNLHKSLSVCVIGKKPECLEKRTTASLLGIGELKQATLKLEGYTASSAQLNLHKSLSVRVREQHCSQQEPQMLHVLGKTPTH